MLSFLWLLWSAIWSIIGPLVLLYLAFPDRAQIISSHLFKLLGWLGQYPQMRSVKDHIEGNFKLIRKKLNRQVPGLMLQEAEIVWVKPEDVEPKSFVKDNKLIVRMEYYQQQEKNVVNSVYYLIQHHQGRLKGYVASSLGRSMDLALTKKCLDLSNSKQAINYFVQEVLLKELNENTGVADTYHQLEAIDELGFFTRILLTELVKLTNELYPERVGLPEIIEETNALVDFLDQFPKRASGEEIQLTFLRNNIRIAVVIVANPHKIKRGGYDPYLRRIEDRLTGQFDTVYVCSMDKLRSEAETVCILAERSGVKIRSRSNYWAVYHGKTRKAVCLRLERPR